MQDIFQQFISFLLDSWKSLIFLFVFSFILKETIGKVILYILRVITHLILDLSDKSASPFYSKDWEITLRTFIDIKPEYYAEIYFLAYDVHRGNYEVLSQKITNKKIRTKYFNLIARYELFIESSFAFAILLYSDFSSKLIKKAKKNLEYIQERKYKNQFTQIIFLLIHKLKFFFLKIYVFNKTIDVFKEIGLINNFRNVIHNNKNQEEFNFAYNLKVIPPVNGLELLYDVSQYSKYQISKYQIEPKGLLFSDLASSGASNGQELVNKINESEFLRDMKFDVILYNDEKKLLDTNYQVIKSPNFSKDSWDDYVELVFNKMMVVIDTSDYWGIEYLCPDSQELQYKYRFVSNVQIEKVIQLIDYHKGRLNIYISKGNLEESLKKHLLSKSIMREKNYYFVRRIQMLQRKINNVFKYIDYTFILIYFIISIFIEQNYLVLLEASITSLLESLKSYL